MKRILSTIVLASALTIAVGCESTEEATTQPAASMGMINDTCPIMGNAVDPDGESVEYEGHAIGFCCPGCKPKWEAMSDRDKAAFVASQAK